MVRLDVYPPRAEVELRRGRGVPCRYASMRSPQLEVQRRRNGAALKSVVKTREPHPLTADDAAINEARGACRAGPT